MHQLILPDQVFSIFFFSNRVCPEIGRVHGKLVRGLIPSHMHGIPTGQPAQSSTSLPHPAAAVRHSKSCGWVTEQPGVLGMVWQGEMPPTKVPEDL